MKDCDRYLHYNLCLFFSLCDAMVGQKRLSREQLLIKVIATAWHYIVTAPH